MRNVTMANVREFIRAPYAQGGYPKVLVMSDGEFMCVECAKDNYRLVSEATRNGERYTGWAAAGIDVYWEGPIAFCCNCGKDIVSAYGDPEDSD